MGDVVLATTGINREGEGKVEIGLWVAAVIGME
jgi:hypothetical protein